MRPRFFLRFAPAALAIALPLASLEVRAEVDAESFKRLESDVSALTESRDALQRQIRELRDVIIQLRGENSKLRADMALVGKDNATREELKKVVDQVQEADRKRVADGKLVHDKLEEIAKLASKPVVLPPVEEIKPPKARSESAGSTSRKSAASSDTVAKPDDDGIELPSEYFEHTVTEGDTLGTIIAAYNKKGYKIKQAHILKANPKLKDPRRIYVGMKLRIPAVK